MRILFTICRYFPLLFYPFYLWAWIPVHSKELCEKLICPLYGFCSVFVRVHCASFQLRTYACTLEAIIGTRYLTLSDSEATFPFFLTSIEAVVLIRSYAFSGQHLCVLILLCTCYIGLAGADIWMFFTQFIRE